MFSHISSALVVVNRLPTGHLSRQQINDIGPRVRYAGVRYAGMQEREYAGVRYAGAGVCRSKVCRSME